MGIASCVFDVQEAATAWAILGTSIQASARGCPNYDRSQVAYDVQIRDAVKKGLANGLHFTAAVELAKKTVTTTYKDIMDGYCMVPITQLLDSLTRAITFISMSISHCQADKYDVRATCTAGISGLLDGVSFLSWQATQAKLACSDLKESPRLPEHLAKESVLKVGQGTI